jgi:Pentapeptide repeats (8 copies)
LTAVGQSESPLQPASERVRASAKWLIAAFGAIGAALAIGAQFSSIGKLEGHARTLALLGVALAFIGIGVALLGVALLLVPRSRTLKGLAQSEALEKQHSHRLSHRDPALRYFETAPELLSPFESVSDLFVEREKFLRMQQNAYFRWSRDRSAQNAATLTSVSTVAAPVEQVATRVINWANYATLRRDYSRTIMFVVTPGLIVASVGILIFALKITNVPPTSPTPAAVRLQGIDLKGADLSKKLLIGADLTKADLRGANLTDADLAGTTLSGARLDGANLTRAG